MSRGCFLDWMSSQFRPRTAIYSRPFRSAISAWIFLRRNCGSRLIRPTCRWIPPRVHVQMVVDEEIVGSPEEEIVGISGRGPSPFRIEQARRDASLGD